jgi:hypothetical protein
MNTMGEGRSIRLAQEVSKNLILYYKSNFLHRQIELSLFSDSVMAAAAPFDTLRQAQDAAQDAGAITGVWLLSHHELLKRIGA